MARWHIPSLHILCVLSPGLNWPRREADDQLRKNIIPI